MTTDKPDTRLQEERFQSGHMLGIYWETIARWGFMRAERDAKTLRTPLLLLQAADVSSPPMQAELAAKLMNHYNPNETGHLHGMLPVHLGMRVRLTDTLDKTKGLVKDAEGVIVHVALHPADQARVDAAAAAGDDREPVYLEHIPLGVWLKMDKYKGAPFADALHKADPDLSSAVTASLVFLEPTQTLFPFKWRGHSISRIGFSFSHGRVRTSTACQGKTLHGGVVIDCARRDDGNHPMEDDAWWLHLYVMISRATKLDDLLLLRAPPESFLLRGPPEDLRRQLDVFRGRVDTCRQRAEELVRELGLQRFLR